jgi:hypothetical protein
MTGKFKILINSLYDHLMLLEAGLPDEQALRIAFDDKAYVAIDIITELLLEEDEEKQRKILEDFWK